MRQLTVAHAHCDLYCGVYDPAQAKIEAMSVLKIAEKYASSDDEVFKARAISLKEERAEEVKHHLMVLWADFFTAEHRDCNSPTWMISSGERSIRPGMPRSRSTPKTGEN